MPQREMAPFAAESFGERSSRRGCRHNPQRGQVLWLTGLSGAGKSTLAYALEARLNLMGRRCVVLDGDNLRAGLCAGLGFTPEDRRENLRRAAEVAKLLPESGLIV
jgi:adenylylsulfate kinase